jgi:hypothetical protein
MELDNVLYRGSTDTGTKSTSISSSSNNSSTSSEDTTSSGGIKVLDEPAKCRLRIRLPVPTTVLVQHVPNFEIYKNAMQKDLSTCGLCLHHGNYQDGLFFVFAGALDAKKCAQRCRAELRRMRSEGYISCKLRSETLKGWPDLFYDNQQPDAKREEPRNSNNSATRCIGQITYVHPTGKFYKIDETIYCSQKEVQGSHPHKKGDFVEYKKHLYQIQVDRLEGFVHIMRSVKPYKNGKENYKLENAGEGIGKICKKSGSKF